MTTSEAFEAGAIWALEMLKRQTWDRQTRFRHTAQSLEATAGTALEVVARATEDVRHEFEVEFMKEIRPASARFAEEDSP